MATYGLPPELWLEVFGNLDYLALKTGVSATCKYFNSLLSTPESSSSKSKPPPRRTSKLDVTLFRDSPKKRTTKLNLGDYTLHPWLLKHGFELRGVFCDLPCCNAQSETTDDDDDDDDDDDASRCMCEGGYLYITKSFDAYEDIRILADEMYGLLTAGTFTHPPTASTPPRMFVSAENAISPAPSSKGIPIKFEVEGVDPVGFYVIPTLRRVLQDYDILIHKLWAQIVLLMDPRCRKLLGGSLVQSYNRLKYRVENDPNKEYYYSIALELIGRRIDSLGLDL